MRKVLLSLSFFGLAFSQDVNVNMSQVQLIDTQALTNEIMGKFEGKLHGLLESWLSDLGLPPELKAPADQIVQALYQEILCRIRTPRFHLEIPLPDSVTIPLPCSQVNIGFSPIYKKILSKANTLTGGLIDTAQKCINGDLDSCKSLAKEKGVPEEEVKKKRIQNDVMYEKGLGQEDLAEKKNEEIKKEYEKRVNTLSKPSVDTTNPKGVVKNDVVQDARFSAENEASSSTGELLGWGKEYTKNFPKQVKPYYNYIANEQLMRKTVIQALRQRIKEERTELVRLASEVRAWCNKEWEIKTLPPVREEAVLGFEPSNFYAVLTRGGCPCSAISSYVKNAKNDVKAKIEEAKREIEHTIERVGEMIANTISAEAYRTRQQINAVGQGISDSLKQTMCFRARLEFQRNKLLLLDMEIKLAELQAIYSMLNNEEMKEYKGKLKKIRIRY
jgi:hypothetical protein